jgi:hypothetical protein
MSDDRYRRVIASVPANKTAGRVTARGEHWEPSDKIPADRAHWTAPPDDCRQRPPSVPDLVGVKFGRFTVAQYRHSRKYSEDGKLVGINYLWLVRCSCGDYEERTTRTILAAQADPEAYADQMCWNCERLEVMKKRSAGVGEWPEDRRERVLAASGGEAAMTPSELHEIKNALGWGWGLIASKAGRDLSRVRKMASGKEPIDQHLADWLRQQRYRKNAGLT